MGKEAVEWILSQTEVDVVYCENDAIPILLESNTGKFLKTIISANEPSASEKELIATNGLRIYSVADLILMGGKKKAEGNDDEND